MCLAVPGLVKSIENQDARIDLAGIERMVNIMLVPDVQVGQYVLVHAGFAIQTLDTAEAAEILALFDEMKALTEGGEV